MPFCSNCGNKIENEDNFCLNCGTPLKENNNESKREIVFEGTIYKCPNCGEVLNSFTANCPACGYELRNSKNSNSVAELARRLEEIEKKRDADMELKLMRMRGFYGAAAVGLSPIDEQKISLIRNFPIPNTKEDLYEFLILSKSNINISNSGIMTVNDARYAISNAWKSKFEQAYLKAKLLFNNDERMLEINKMYEEMNNSIKHADWGFWIVLGLFLGIPILFFMIIFIIL